MSTDVVTTVAEATTFLFVPGDRPERFGTAFDTSADVVIIDLEDAVAPENKTAALTATVAALGGEGVPSDFRALVRVNTIDDIPALVAAGTSRLLGVMIPKADGVAALDAVADALPAGLAVVALIETARGVADARAIAEHPRVTRLAFGAIDFSADVDATAPAVLDHARAALVIASRVAELPAPVESPSTNFTDLDSVESDARHARSLGFGGKLCIHPAQLAAVATGFAPTDDEVEWATRVVSLDGGAVQLDGVMVDKPVVDRAKRILARRNGR
ncbi:MAG: Citrate lyase subunit beta-like protein [Actinomycetota bacterium]|jgi:citrate lyase subunit beta/citryl-CoA lyase